jgi:hypothetical protein
MALALPRMRPRRTCARLGRRVSAAFAGIVPRAPACSRQAYPQVRRSGLPAEGGARRAQIVEIAGGPFAESGTSRRRQSSACKVGGEREVPSGRGRHSGVREGQLEAEGDEHGAGDAVHAAFDAIAA